MKPIDQMTINTIRILSAEGVQKANSGHPGLPLGAAPMTYELWANHMKHNSENPNWVDRDRFILSAGHGSMLLYSMLHLFGYGLTIEDLKQFRQFKSKTPGHPEYGYTVGVETTTGPLGQGFTNAVGMAMAEAHLAAHFNRPNHPLVDHYTYTLVGDGCLMEGITAEAASLAGTLKLGKLIALYDSNNISIEGSTDIAFTEDVGKRFEAYHWQVLTVEDGNDIEAIGAAIREAKVEKEKPSLIIIKTQIGYGSPKQGSASAHGEPLGVENLQLTKDTLEWTYADEFYVPDEVRAHMYSCQQKGQKEEKKWNSIWESYRVTYPDLAKEWEQWHSKELPVNLLEEEAFWQFADKPAATRNASGEILNRLSKIIPNLMGGSADLSPSTKTIMEDRGHFSAGNYEGSNLHFGVREHAMAGIGNGLALHGGILPYVSTFFVFTDYMKGSMRLSALMGIPVIYVLTHDSIGVGEDGPTHEPIEHLVGLRSTPNFTVIRPADSKETAAAWYTAVTNQTGPTALVLTRQNLPHYQETSKDALKGAYILLDSEKETPDLLLMATGSEVELIYNAHSILKEKGIDARVISMPSWELFEAQSEEYKNQVMPREVRARVAVEAASSCGWHKYIGLDGATICMESFGESAPAATLFEHFGFTVENVVNTSIDVVNKLK